MRLTKEDLKAAALYRAAVGHRVATLDGGRERLAELDMRRLASAQITGAVASRIARDDKEFGVGDRDRERGRKLAAIAASQRAALRYVKADREDMIGRRSGAVGPAKAFCGAEHYAVLRARRADVRYVEVRDSLGVVVGVRSRCALASEAAADESAFGLEALDRLAALRGRAERRADEVCERREAARQARDEGTERICETAQAYYSRSRPAARRSKRGGRRNRK